MKRFIVILLALVVISEKYLISQNDNYMPQSNQDTLIVVLSMDSIKNVYEREAIYFDGYGNYIKNGATNNVGLFNKNLKAELVKSDEATVEFKTYRRLVARGFILYFGGFTSAILVNLLTVSPIGTIFIIPALYSIVVFSDATTHYNKAIWAYNRDIVLKALSKNKTK